MKFRKGSAYHLVSECGEYSVAKVIVGGEVQYEAWHMPDGKKPAIALGARETSSLDCVQLCRRHFEKRGNRAA